MSRPFCPVTARTSVQRLFLGYMGLKNRKDKARICNLCFLFVANAILFGFGIYSWEASSDVTDLIASSFAIELVRSNHW